MKDTVQALKNSFNLIFLTAEGDKSYPPEKTDLITKLWEEPARSLGGYWSFKFGENKEFELRLEPEEEKYFLALYKEKELLIDKVPIGVKK